MQKRKNKRHQSLKDSLKVKSHSIHQLEIKKPTINFTGSSYIPNDLFGKRNFPPQRTPSQNNKDSLNYYFKGEFLDQNYKKPTIFKKSNFKGQSNLILKPNQTLLIKKQNE